MTCAGEWCGSKAEHPSGLCSRCEIERLRDEAQHDQKTLVLQSEMLVEKDAEIARLRDATAILERSLSDQVRENARLRAAISEFVEAFDRDPIKYADLMDRTREAVEAICRIAREGR